MWSCFDLGEVDPSLASVVVFRQDGGFAYYRLGDGKSGWLVPGTTMRTDFGPLTVSLPVAASSSANTKARPSP